MRAHIEFVVTDDLVQHEAELPESVGAARQRNLSYDEENGAATAAVTFDADWSRPAGYHAADTEWFVRRGRVRLGSTELGTGGYFRAPSGLRVPELRVAAGTEVVLIRDGADQTFVVSDYDRSSLLPAGLSSRSGRRAELTVCDSDTMSWEANPLAGDCEWHAQLSAKVLYRDPSPLPEPSLGASTLLLQLPVGWVNPQYEHHSCWQELVVLEGAVRYNFGSLTRGSYVYRPSNVKHGTSQVTSPEAAVLLVRFGGVPEHWITEDPTVSALGMPVNYDPDNPAEAPVPAGIPQRSASVGPWSGYMK